MMLVNDRDGQAFLILFILIYNIKINISIITVPTRNLETLEKIITDLQSYFHPPTSHTPLEVDEDKEGENSDHNVVILTPVNIVSDAPKQTKRTIKTRPLPESKIREFHRKDHQSFLSR